MMQKLFFQLKGVLFLILLSISFPELSALTFEVKGIWYETLEDNKAAVIPIPRGRYDEPKYKGDVNIPETVEYGEITYVVTEIQGAFSGSYELTSVSMPESITHIGASAFNGCSGLKTLLIPKNVISIGDYAFFGCTGLQSLLLPEGVTSIGNSAFGGCTGLRSLLIPEGVTYIGSAAFSGCTNIKSYASFPAGR